MKQINKKLALALGHKSKDILFHPFSKTIYVYQDTVNHAISSLRLFDYKDPTILWGICNKYNCFPFMYYDGWKCDGLSLVYDTPELAVAMFVINKK